MRYEFEIIDISNMTIWSQKATVETRQTSGWKLLAASDTKLYFGKSISKWEYTHRELRDFIEQDEISLINTMASMGWQLQTCTIILNGSLGKYYFKREVI